MRKELRRSLQNISTDFKGSSIQIPQVEALWRSNLKWREPLIMSIGGRSPEINWFRELAEIDKKVWAVDSGSFICKESNIIPDSTIGDLDSIDRNTLTWLRSKDVPIEEFPPEKDLTDFQLALKLGSGYSPIVISGCWGGRFDHSWSNLYSSVWARANKIDVRCMADNLEVLFFIDSDEEVLFKIKEDRPKAISLLSIGTNTEQVSTEGLKWELKEALLKEAFPYSVSNELLEGRDSFTVSIGQGLLGVYMTWSNII